LPAGVAQIVGNRRKPSSAAAVAKKKTASKMLAVLTIERWQPARFV